MNFYESALSLRNHLQSRIKHLSGELASCPEGSLRCHKNGCSYRYYQFLPDPTNRHNGTRHHISRKNLELARGLAMKTFLNYQISDLRNELLAVNSYLRLHKDSKSGIPKLMVQNEGFRALLVPQFYTLTEELERWATEPYDRLEEYPEALNVQTISGAFVRSKSESMIYSMLVQKGIPFRYECKIKIGEREVYPDFMIRHPANGKLILWEHFGLCDDPEYQSTMFTKLARYLRNGYIPGTNLIITFETKNSPLSQSLIHDIINHYLG